MTISEPTRTMGRHVALVLIVGTLGLVLALQGWRTRRPFEDVLDYIDGAHDLVIHGRLPVHGPMTNFLSYAPPGLAWAVVPGLAMFDDLRLSDAPGNALLHVGTLIGVYLLARACFGIRCALLSVLLYGVSQHALRFAGTGVPIRGHPVFYVWTTYWTCWWVALGRSRYLAAALITWAAGMYAFLEVAPAVFMLPAAWVFYRPPVRLRALAVSAVVALLLWYPYLRFETARGFVDLRSQVLRETIWTEFNDIGWCDAAGTLRRSDGGAVDSSDAGGRHATTRPTAVRNSGMRALTIARGLVFNFEGCVPGGELVLLVLTASGILMASVRHQPRLESRNLSAGAADAYPWLTALAVALFVGAGLSNEWVIARLLGRPGELGPFAVPAVRIVQAMALL